MGGAQLDMARLDMSHS